MQGVEGGGGGVYGSSHVDNRKQETKSKVARNRYGCSKERDGGGGGYPCLYFFSGCFCFFFWVSIFFLGGGVYTFGSKDFCVIFLPQERKRERELEGQTKHVFLSPPVSTLRASTRRRKAIQREAVTFVHIGSEGGWKLGGGARERRGEGERQVVGVVLAWSNNGCGSDGGRRIFEVYLCFVLFRFFFLLRSFQWREREHTLYIWGGGGGGRFIFVRRDGWRRGVGEGAFFSRVERGWGWCGGEVEDRRGPVHPSFFRAFFFPLWWRCFGGGVSTPFFLCVCVSVYLSLLLLLLSFL